MSLQAILLKMNKNYALAVGPSALHKSGGILTGHFLLNAVILLSSSPVVKKYPCCILLIEECSIVWGSTHVNRLMINDTMQVLGIVWIIHVTYE